MDVDTVRVLKPEVTATEIAYRDTGARLAISAREIGQPMEIVDGASCFDLGYADAADTKTTNGKPIGLALEMQCAAAEIAAADESDLDLFEGNLAGRFRFRRENRERGDRQHRHAEKKRTS